MKGFEHRGIAAAVIGAQAILAKALRRIVIRGFDHHVDTPTQILDHRAAIALFRSDHLHLAFMVQLGRPASTGRKTCASSSVPARREPQAVRCWRQAGGVGDCCHFDAALGAVEKGIEHLRIHSGSSGLLGIEAVVLPDGIWR